MPRTKRPLAASTMTTSSRALDELTQEERARYNSLLEDFDRQMQVNLDNAEKTKEALIKELEMMGKVAALSVPK